MRLEITDTDGATFRDDNCNHELDAEARQREIVRILREIAYNIERGDTGGVCRDFNGNTVGTWSL